MFKLIVVYKRQPAVSHDDFKKYWLGEFARATTAKIKAEKYIQDYPLILKPGWVPPLDGIAMVACAKAEECRAAAKLLTAVKEDIVDVAKTQTVIAEEKIIPLPGNRVAGSTAKTATPMKIIELLNRKEGMSSAEFITGWYGMFSPRVAANVPGITRYIQNHPVDPARTVYDGVAEMYYNDVEDWRGAVAWSKTEPGQKHNALGVTFVGKIAVMVAQEQVNI